MQQLIERDIGNGVAHVAHSTRADGDLSPSAVAPADLAERRQAAVALPWQALYQLHSDRVITATHQTATDSRPHADALVTSQPGLALAVHSGDCVPVGFIHSCGVAAAHAGWKGLELGVLESTVRRVNQLADAGAISASADAIEAVVGPHIRSAHYEFGERDLERLAARFGDQVIATTSLGQPALDLTAAITAELERLEVNVVATSPDCTAADADRYWSHRARAESGRIALVAWIDDATR